jgi:antitoxin VapB
MNMQINIKNAKARALADELCHRTGESITEAVTTAMTQRLRALKRDELTAKWDSITADNRELWKEPFLSTDHGDLLYDDMGLPK